MHCPLQPSLSARFPSSHCSPGSRTPFPHVLTVQPFVSIAHDALHDSAPESKPSPLQVLPARSAPSHCSPGSMIPLPQAKFAQPAESS